MSTMARIKPPRIALLCITALHLALAGACEGAETVQSRMDVAEQTRDNVRKGLEEMERAKGWSDSPPDSLSIRLTLDGNLRIPEGPVSTEAVSLLQVHHCVEKNNNNVVTDDDGGSDDTKETDSSDSATDKDSDESEISSCFAAVFDLIEVLFRCLLSPFKWVYTKLSSWGGSGKKNPAKKNNDAAPKQGDDKKGSDDRGSDNQGSDTQGNGNDRRQNGGNRNDNRSNSESESQRQSDPAGTDANLNSTPSQFLHSTVADPAPVSVSGDYSYTESIQPDSHTLYGDLGDGQIQRSNVVRDLSLDFESNIVDGPGVYDRNGRVGRSDFNTAVSGPSHNSGAFLASSTLSTASCSPEPYPSMAAAPGRSMPSVQTNSKTVESSFSIQNPSMKEKSRDSKERLSTISIAETALTPNESNDTGLPVGVASTLGSTITMPAVDMSAVDMPEITMPATSSTVPAHTVPEVPTPTDAAIHKLIQDRVDEWEFERAICTPMKPLRLKTYKPKSLSSYIKPFEPSLSGVSKKFRIDVK